FDYQWRDYDYLSDDGSAGLRLYFYDREYPVARIAGGLIRESWRYLSDRFQYKPSFRVPYILYNTYREFLETNVFAVQEGVLGVTSPQDLRMSLPYAGEREFFKLVSTHEMTHQFHIQKVAERAASAGMESPIGQFPLWFIEGLAEYYAHNQQMDSETEMFLRDIVLNPNGEIGYDFPRLDEDRPYSYLYTYKYGQAKLVFLSETYGERVIQGVLDQSPRLAGGGRQRGEPREGFMQLLGHVAGETPAQMNARWQTWARKRVMRTYLDAKQDLPDVTELKLPDELDTRSRVRRERRDEKSPRVRVDLDLGDVRTIRVVRDGLIEARDPTFSPDGMQVAFYGLDRDGHEDIYTLDLREDDPHVRRLTQDPYSERDLSWGEDGIVYASDATESGRYNLFRIDPENGTRVR